MSESEEDGSVILDFDGVNSTNIHIAENPDAEYEGELGYSLVKSLRGKSAGRRLKRKLFKFGFFQLTCGFALLVICIEESENFRNIRYFETAPYGASLQDLMWCVSVPSFFMGLVTMTAVRYWASLTTNRKLLGSLVRIYVGCFVLIFLFTLWCACVLFMQFSKIRDWGASVTLASIYPYYISTVIFIMPYLAVQLLYSLDLSYLGDEVDMGGNIEEPDPPENVMDLSDVTLAQSCIFVCAMPCIMCVQLSDLIAAIVRAYNRNYRESAAVPTGKKRKTTPAPKQNKGIVRRMWKTVNRYFRGSRKKEVRPVATAAAENAELELMDLQKDREQEERLERERIKREQDERRRVIEFEEAAAAAELQRKQEMQLFEAAKALNEKKIREEEERLRRMQEQQEAEEKESERWEPTMTVPLFKSVWSALPTAGSFQCKLKVLPELQPLTNHLKRQGFHIVFAANPTPNDVEIGVCNVRKSATDSWFMARFLATQTSFSAVMKAQTTEEVTGYVKKFALAKVLKIDTAK